MMKTPRSIVLVRLSAIGDVVMFVPVIHALQAAFPQAQLTWVISPLAYSLVSSLKGVEFLVLEKPKSVRDYYRFYQQLKHRHFDILLAAQASFRANLLYPLIKAKQKIGYDKRRANDGHGWFVHETISPGHDHTLEGFLKFAKAAGVQQPVVQSRVPIEEKAIAWAKVNLPSGKDYFIINPAASQSERNWVLERYASIAKMAPERWGVQVVLTGGPGAHERFLADEILKVAPNCLDFVGKTKPSQLLAVLSQAKAVLCPDTGPSHMAASVETPVIALHAVTSSAISGPYAFRHLAVDYYAEAHQTFFKKTIGEPLWGTQIHGPEVMALIPLEVVVRRLDDVLTRKDEA